MACSTTTLILRNPAPALSLSTHRQITGLHNHRPLLLLSKPRPTLSLSTHPNPLNLRISASISQGLKTPVIKLSNNPNPAQDLLVGSTRTVTTLFSVAIVAAKVFAHGLFTLAVQLKEPLLHSACPAFFAAISDVSTGSLNTPFTVVAAGMAKWLDLYSGVLMVRVLLSWFPNIPWDRQPLSAIRDLCDPYLNLFRNIIPPIFDTLDVSPLLAFAVLGTLGSILNSSRRAY